MNSWYGVKSVYQFTPIGRASSKDRHFFKGVSAVEERIVLFKCSSSRAAILKAEKEAQRYASLPVVNAYGQRVVCKYLGRCEAFIIDGLPENGAEVYSSISVNRKKLRRAEILQRKFDRGSTSFRRRTASMFIDVSVWQDMVKYLEKKDKRGGKRRVAA